MMFWFNRHRRLRDQLSAYIDGELDDSAAERLERHLAECGRCRQEMEQLRATVAALQELPAVEPPRSFTLSPERAAAPRPAQPGVTPLALGMRLAAAGVAAALVAVVLVDLGDVGDNGAGDGDAASQMLSERLAEEGGLDATDDPAPDGMLDPTPVAPGAATGGAAGEAPAPDGGLAETPAAPSEDDSELGLMSGNADEEPEEEEPAATVFPSIEELERAVEEQLRGDKDGGIDALTAVEIGLAFALGLLVAGSLALAFAGRRR